MVADTTHLFEQRVPSTALEWAALGDACCVSLSDSVLGGRPSWDTGCSSFAFAKRTTEPPQVSAPEFWKEQKWVYAQLCFCQTRHLAGQRLKMETSNNQISKRDSQDHQPKPWLFRWGNRGLEGACPPRKAGSRPTPAQGRRHHVGWWGPLGDLWSEAAGETPEGDVRTEPNRPSLKVTPCFWLGKLKGKAQERCSWTVPRRVLKYI